MKPVYRCLVYTAIVLLLNTATISPSPSYSREEKVICWLEWLTNHQAKLSSESNLTRVLPDYMFDYQDKIFGGNFVHQLARSCSSFPPDVIKKILTYVAEEGHSQLIYEKDNDGDTPLHSAIRSQADQSKIWLFATVCDHTHSVLLTPNKKNETPLELAFTTCLWPGVQVLLSLSIQNNVLGHLTGIKADGQRSKTLLHEAMESGHIDYLEILLQVCEKLNIPVMQALVFPDERGSTPWCSLASRAKYDEIERALSLISEYNIDVNHLYTDVKTGSTLLHEATRRDDEQFKVILKKYKAEEKIDNRGVMPHQRNHQLVCGFLNFNQLVFGFLNLNQSSDVSSQETQDDFAQTYPNSIDLHGSQHPVESMKELLTALETINKLDFLCTYLGVHKAVISELDYTGEVFSTKKRRCLESFYNIGPEHATWEKVIEVVRGPYIRNNRLAKCIEEKYVLKSNKEHDC